MILVKSKHRHNDREASTFTGGCKSPHLHKGESVCKQVLVVAGRTCTGRCSLHHHTEEVADPCLLLLSLSHSHTLLPFTHRAAHEDLVAHGGLFPAGGLAAWHCCLGLHASPICKYTQHSSTAHHKMVGKEITGQMCSNLFAVQT